MFVRSLKLSLAACAVAAFVSAPAFAAEPHGWYLGAGVGYAQNKLSDNVFPSGTSEKTNDIGFKIYGGYQFTPNWAVEAEYLNFGKYSANYPGDGSDQAKTSGLGISAVGTLPLSAQFALLGKLGVLAKYTKANSYDNSGNSFYSQNKTTTAVLLGLGAEYRFTQNFALRGEYEYAGKTSIGNAGAKINNSLLSVSARYSF